MKNRKRNQKFDKIIEKSQHSAFTSSDCKDVFRPLSHYLMGGVDVEGELLDRDLASVEYDNEEELAALEEEGASAVALGNPRESLFTIVERAGIKGATSAIDKAKAGEGVDAEE